MSIVIQNMGPTSAEEAQDFNGERRYHVRINHNHIADFTHYRGDGLAECLRKAAQAVEDK